MAIQKSQAIVLKREEVRETSILLTVYTKDFGKLKLISKGVRSPEQKFISAYELLALCDIVFYERKRKGYLLLSQCELVDFFPKISKSLLPVSRQTDLLPLIWIQIIHTYARITRQERNPLPTGCCLRQQYPSSQADLELLDI